MITITSSPYQRSFVRNAICFSFQSSYDGSTVPDNYRIIVRVLLEKEFASETFEQVSEHLVEFADDFSVHFDFSEVLEREILKTFNDPPIPDFNEDGAYVANTLRRYKIEYAERFGIPPQNQTFQQATEMVAYLGGISPELFAKGDFFEALDANNSFLTWYPDRKRISPGQPEYIAWFNHLGSPTQVTLKVDMYGMSEIGVKHSQNRHILNKFDDPNIIPEDQIAIFPIGLPQLALPEFAWKLSHYTVQVFSGEIPVSPKRTYIIDYTYRNPEYLILYLNGFYQPSVIRCLGQKRIGIDIERQISTRITSCQPQLLKGNVFQNEYKFDQITTYRTGFLSKKEKEVMQELILYNRAFEIYPDGYVPIMIIDNNFDQGNDFDILRSHEFQAVNALKKKTYSDAAEIPQQICSALMWQTDDENCWTTPPGQLWEAAN